MRLPGEQVTMWASRRLLNDWFAHRFVMIANNDHEAVVPPGSIYNSGCILGVLGFDGRSGSDAAIKCGGHIAVEAGASIAVGDEVVYDNNGRGIPRGTVATVRYRVAGRAMSPAAVNELFILRFGPYSVFGANAG